MAARQNSIPSTIKKSQSRTVDQTGHLVQLFCIPSSNKIQDLFNLCNTMDEEERWSTTFCMRNFFSPERVIMCNMELDIDIQKERKLHRRQKRPHVWVCKVFLGLSIFHLFYCHFNMYISKVVLDFDYCYYYHYHYQRDGCVTSNPKWNCPIGHPSRDALRKCVHCTSEQQMCTICYTMC